MAYSPSHPTDMESDVSPCVDYENEEKQSLSHKQNCDLQANTSPPLNDNISSNKLDDEPFDEDDNGHRTAKKRSRHSSAYKRNSHGSHDRSRDKSSRSQEQRSRSREKHHTRHHSRDKGRADDVLSKRCDSELRCESHAVEHRTVPHVKPLIISSVRSLYVPSVNVSQANDKGVVSTQRLTQCTDALRFSSPPQQLNKSASQMSSEFSSNADSKLVLAAQQLLNIAQMPSHQHENPAKNPAQHIMNLAGHVKQAPENAKQSAQDIFHLAQQQPIPNSSQSPFRLSFDDKNFSSSTAAAAAAAASAALGLRSVRPLSRQSTGVALPPPPAPSQTPQPPPHHTNLLQSILNQVGLIRPGGGQSQIAATQSTATTVATVNDSDGSINKLINSTASNLLAVLQAKSIPKKIGPTTSSLRETVGPTTNVQSESDSSKKKVAENAASIDLYNPADSLPLLNSKNGDCMKLRKRSDFSNPKDWQERVASEVKLVLRPLYGARKINKNEYKEILKTAVVKIVCSKPSEIKSDKINRFVTLCYKKSKAKRTEKKQSIASSSD